MPVYTFLEAHNWKGKTVIPFCTHEGSGLSGTESRIRSTCKGATVEKGLAVQGKVAQTNRSTAKKAVQDWLAKLGKKAVSEEKESERSVFNFHVNPNPKCPVGSKIHAVLDQPLDNAQKALEEELKKTTIKDLMGKL